MRVFVTGASGWIGSAVVPLLVEAGHDVVGLARSDEAAAAVEALGGRVLAGGLDDVETLRAGAGDSDGVIHLGFKHDFANYSMAGQTERAAVTALGDALEGSQRPLVMASGVALVSPGRVVTEHDTLARTGPEAPRGGGEHLALDYAARGIRAVALRFAPTVHGAGDYGFVPTLIQVARERGVSAYIGDGANRWPAVHRSDAAKAVHLAFEKAPAGSAVHVVAEEGIPTREIAATIGANLNVPVISIDRDAADEHFGWIAAFFALDVPASNTLTRQMLEWRPSGPDLLDDLNRSYFQPGVPPHGPRP